MVIYWYVVCAWNTFDLCIFCCTLIHSFLITSVIWGFCYFRNWQHFLLKLNFFLCQDSACNVKNVERHVLHFTVARLLHPPPSAHAKFLRSPQGECQLSSSHCHSAGPDSCRVSAARWNPGSRGRLVARELSLLPLCVFDAIQDWPVFIFPFPANDTQYQWCL